MTFTLHLTGIWELEGKGVPGPNGHCFVLENGKQGRPTPGKEGKPRPRPFQFIMKFSEGRVFLEDEFLEIVVSQGTQPLPRGNEIRIDHHRAFRGRMQDPGFGQGLKRPWS